MRFYLITHHGLFLRSHMSGGLTQVALEEITSRDSLASVELEPAWARQSFRDFIASSEAGTVDAFVEHLGPCTVHNHVNARTISLQFNGFFVTALPHGAVDCNRQEAHAWEFMLPCSDDDLDLLETLKASRWIIKSARRLISGESIQLSDNFDLSINGIRVPLAYNLSLDRTTHPFRIVILIDAWRIEELILFRPLIYYLAFGQSENVFDQLNLSLKSLAQIGSYDGQVLILTDRSAEEIHHANPWFDKSKIDTSYIPASDWVGYVAGKYCIVEETKAFQHQPVVYMDPDIIFNIDVQPMLIEMAVSDRMTAPLESFSSLEAAPSVGATLLQMDNAQPRFACGFNGGTIGIPNIPAHKHTLILIRTIIANFLSTRGRNAFPWVDQEAANYVSYKIAHFDTNQISRFVRYGFNDLDTPIEPRTGLVHFWGVARKRRPEVMRTYLNGLTGIETTSAKPSVSIEGNEADDDDEPPVLY